MSLRCFPWLTHVLSTFAFTNVAKNRLAAKSINVRLMWNTIQSRTFYLGVCDYHCSTKMVPNSQIALLSLSATPMTVSVKKGGITNLGTIATIRTQRTPTKYKTTKRSAMKDTNLASDGTSHFKKQKLNEETKKHRKNGTVKKTNLQRIDKILADRGVGTRSQTFDIAKANRITVANHPDAPHEERTRIRGPSERIPSNAVLFMDGKLLPGPVPLIMVYHKPKYMLSVMEDHKKYKDLNRRHLGQVLDPRYERSGMHPVGRLDYDTSGLILFSSDGKLTQRLLHPRRMVEKEYVATVQGEVDEANLRSKLAEGVKTTEGVHCANLIEVTLSDGPSNEKDGDLMNVVLEDEDDELVPRNDYVGPFSDVRLIVTEGKYRMVRRMLHNCGHSVVELRRDRHGMFRLDNLKVGDFRMATTEELEWAKALLT